ncbi:sirohydrochlorin chelatase [Nocardia asteroides]|uniref:sirohydrochlorin chelatase n=1 Tax=Nocardia asteroides TaxID=1824 RepID=UPI001E2A4CC2|nr:CbiX/SirB N-terminal domain-containing protein [Nocardia asteroides]UGT60503.1 sirohydrochlorin chelatase [Nocardia asteroides]
MRVRPGSNRSAPVLIGVGHGSRDPRSAATVGAVMDAVAAARPGHPVRTAFLDLDAPSVERVLDAVAGAGHRHAVVVPLLLGSAFHARVDLPGLLAAARQRHPLLRVDQAEVLGPDTRLVDALADRVRELRAASDPGVIVAAVGASSAAANARTGQVADELAARTGWRTEICFATTEPGVEVARARLLARGARHLVVAPYFLAPGLLTDRIAAAAADLAHAAALGAHPALTELIWSRYDTAVVERHLRSA